MNEPDRTLQDVPAPAHPERTLDTIHRPSASEHGATTAPSAEPPSDLSGTQLESRPPVSRGAAEPRNLVVPGYEILEELGRGGMGVVYKARQKKTNRVVALKMILASRHADLHDKLRFQIEVEAIARLQHTNIVQLHEAGEHEELPFFSLEFCDGGALDRRLKAQPLSAEEAAALTEKLARAMHYAHLRGVVHRDLKPANVLLQLAPGLPGGSGSPPASRGLYEYEPKITDFGLAKRTDSGSDMSRTGAIMGTPSYMAPEQAEGKVHAIGPAADVYALGAILYELLTGQPPFKGETAFDTIHQLLNYDPVPPGRVRPKVPLDLETICLRCLHKDPARRYASAEALAEDCRRFRAGEPIRARPVGRVERLVKWVKRRPAVAALCGLIVLVAALGLAGILWSYRAAVHERDRARAAEAEARRQRDLAEELLADLRRAGQQRAEDRIDQLLSAAPQAVPEILAGFQHVEPISVRPRLRKIWDESGDNRLRQGRAGMALLTFDEPGVKPKLAAWMLDGDNARETLLLRQVLKPYAVELTPWLWQRVHAADTPSDARFRALLALAEYDPTSAHWASAARDAVGPLLAAQHPVLIQLWSDAMFPVRDAVRAPLLEAFRDHKGGERRLVAANVLAIHAAGRPRELADLVVEADAEQFKALQGPLQKNRAKVTELLRQEFTRTATPSWQDGPLDPAWPALPADVTREIEAAAGMVAPRFALCQTLLLDRAPAVVEALKKSGYRPVQYRPYQVGPAVALAAVWTRDGAEFRLTEGATADELRRRDAEWRAKGFLPLDVASYRTDSGLRHAALWTRKDPAVVDARLYVEVSAADHVAAWKPLQTDGFVPRTQTQVDGEGGPRHSGVWWKPASPFELNYYNFRFAEAVYEKSLSPSRLETDVRLEREVPPEPVDRTDQFCQQLATAESALADRPNDGNLRWQRALALAGLGRYADAAADLDAVRELFPRSALVLRQRTLVRARLGRADDARADLAAYGKMSTTKPGQQANLDALVSALLGEEVAGMKRLESAIAANETDATFLYDAACAYAEAARAIEQFNFSQAASVAALTDLVGPALLGDLRARTGRPAEYAARAVALLRKAVTADYHDYAHMAADEDLAYLRTLPGFRALLDQGHLDRRYSAVWHDSATRVSAETHALDPAANLARCRQLAAEGYRPVSLAVAETVPGLPLVGASVWHLPVVAEDDRVALARRQANAATALFHLGHEDAVWPLLRHSPAPDVRSYLVRDLAARGVDPRIVVKRLGVETDVSACRALILALGEYTAAQLPAEVRSPLMPRLLDWYRTDPDPGIHGAIDWLLRHDRTGSDPRKLDWGAEAALRTADETIAKEPPGDRRWFVSKTGQTFAVLPGPVEFTMGSPATEMGRHFTETMHRRKIPHSLAVATTKVTVAQFRRFQTDVQARYPGVLTHTYQTRYSPDDDGPILALNWYDAAMYCRWLSEQEGVPEDQMCYPPIPEIKPGAPLPKNYLSRTGYRMPTPAEWEYACRAGATTTRFFGESAELLGDYAWYVKNSGDRAWPVGQLKPNDFGLFDMLGNAFERCQDPGVRPAAYGSVVIDAESLTAIPQLKDYAYLRGGAYSYIASNQRSAALLSNLASAQPNTDGLRVVRTWP